MRDAKKINVLFWIVQGLLALFFALGSGAPKLLLPLEALPMPIPLPAAFVKFIGVCEVLGALGLILPGILRMWSGVTTLAAACLVLLTICATVAQLMGGHVGNALFAAGMGLICALVFYGRWRLAPLREPSRPLALAAAS